MNAPICCIMTHSTAKLAISFVEAPTLGHGEVADKPIAVPKVRSTNEIAAASNAPASTAPHSTKLTPATGAATPAAGADPTCVMTMPPLAKPKGAENEHHDHDETDDVDDVVHG